MWDGLKMYSTDGGKTWVQGWSSTFNRCGAGGPAGGRGGRDTAAYWHTSRLSPGRIGEEHLQEPVTFSVSNIFKSE